MTKAEAAMPGISDEERRLYLRVSRDKTNLVPPTRATWLHLASVQLPNGEDGKPGDNMQVAESWDYPQPCDGVTADDMRWARTLVGRDAAYRTDQRAESWVGYAVAEHLGLDVGCHGSRERTDIQKGNRKRVSTIIGTWINNGVLAEENRRDEKARKDFNFVVPGPWKDEPGPPAKGHARQAAMERDNDDDAPF
jgi:hypothetical protein